MTYEICTETDNGDEYPVHSTEDRDIAILLLDHAIRQANQHPDPHIVAVHLDNADYDRATLDAVPIDPIATWSGPASPELTELTYRAKNPSNETTP